VRALLDGVDQQAERDAAVEVVVGHDGDVGAGEDLGDHEVDEHRAVDAAELAREGEGVEVEGLDLGEDGVHLGGQHGLAVLHLDALAIDRGGVRGDLVGGEGADHLQDVGVGRDGVVARGVAAGGLVVLLDEGDDRRPVDAALEVEEKVVVVCEEVGHGGLLRALAGAGNEVLRRPRMGGDARCRPA
jgi:hypothetical protein